MGALFMGARHDLFTSIVYVIAVHRWELYMMVTIDRPVWSFRINGIMAH